MESAAIDRPSPRPRLIQAGLTAILIAVAAVAWALTGERMDGMDAGPGTELGGLGWFVVGWVAMMAAMMFPSVAPTVAAFAAIEDERPKRGGISELLATPAFVAGYLAAWTIAGLAGYAVIETVRSLDLGFLAWDEGGRYVAGAIILGAAVYQLTALKESCLHRCRHPREFLVERWHPGGLGALRMGLAHGAFCFGCCWALMAALFALGVMSIGWMVVVAALIAAEKLLPWRALASGAVTIVLAALGLAVALAPGDVPGLTVPGSTEAASAMEAMGMEGEDGGSMGAQPMAPADESMAPADESMDGGAMAP